MAIDKESSGMPEMNVHKRTTKVNLWMVVGILIFFVMMAVIVFVFARQTPGRNGPSASTQEETTGAPGQAPRPRQANSGDASSVQPPGKK